MQTGIKYPYRVFISYSHADKEIVEKIAQALLEMNLVPLWDQDIKPGNSFTLEIKELISRSHIFMPVISKNSYTRPWVHQETGFAIALDIPILPLSIDSAPSEMIAEVQAIAVKSDVSDIIERLIDYDFEKLVLPSPPRPFGTFHIADQSEDRVESLIRYANWVIEIGDYGPVRIQARYSTFGVPDVDIDNDIWEQREGEAKRSKHMRSLQLQERRILERHARMAGCRMIIDPTAATHEAQGNRARYARLTALRDFLSGMPSDKIELVISPRARDTSLISVGDYFFVESRAFRVGGYVHAVFNSHPPSVLRRIKQFDQLFHELEMSDRISLQEAISMIEDMMVDN